MSSNDKIKFTNSDTTGTFYIECFHSKFSFEETVAKIYNLSNRNIFDKNDKSTFNVTGIYNNNIFTLYDYKGGRQINIGGTDELDVVGLTKKLSKLLKATKPKNFKTVNLYDGELYSYPTIDNITYVMLKISCNLGSDMNGTYFIQYTGNEKHISKFLRINKKGDVKFYPKQYSYDQIIALTEFENLFNSGCADNVEVLMLSGKFRVPGENREYDNKELVTWWETYLDCTKFPIWSNIVEEVVDLMN